MNDGSREAQDRREIARLLGEIVDAETAFDKANESLTWWKKQRTRAWGEYQKIAEVSDESFALQRASLEAFELAKANYYAYLGVIQGAVRLAYIADFRGTTLERQASACFNRWLKAHDKKIRTDERAQAAKRVKTWYGQIKAWDALANGCIAAARGEKL